MKGSFSIEASILIPVTVMIMFFAINSGITLYEETKNQAKLIGQQEASDIINMMYRTEEIKEALYEN